MDTQQRVQQGRPMLVDPRILYLLALPDWRPEEATPFQGFAPGLPGHLPALQKLVTLPGDVLEFVIPRRDRLARRAGGAGGWRWLPFNASNLPGVGVSPHAPLLVVFSADEAAARTVEAWASQQAIRPLHVGPAGIAPVTLPELSVAMLAEHCRTSLLAAQAADGRLELGDCLDAIASWRPPPCAESPLRWESHNVTVPNELVLLSEGHQKSRGRSLPWDGRRDAALVAAILDSAAQVRRLREEAGEPVAFRYDPPRPDLILYAPALYHGLEKALGDRTDEFPGLREALRAMRRQRGYAFETDRKQISTPGFAALMGMRGAELRVQATALGLRAASTVAAAIRLPADVNRAAGAVAHLSAHLRTHAGPKPVKTARVFRAVQDAMTRAVDPALMDAIRMSRTGIKLFGDAPLEWLPVGGLPLGIRHDTSRIAATPGGLVFAELCQPDALHLEPEDFLDYLVVSSFEKDDPIRDKLRLGLDALRSAAGERFRGRFEEVGTTAEFVAALNAFRGPVAVIDSHGEHDGDVGVLNIGRERLDVWALRTRVRVPPIVILSACDTHAANRSHATVANGLLHCGARAVLATMLPVRADQAASFVARLLHRAVDFTRASVNSGRAVPWTAVVGGMLRMQLASDIIRALVAKRLLPDDDAAPLQFEANMRLNPHDPGWFEWLAAACRGATGLDEAGWRQHAQDVIAGSDVIRYTHLGNPESIVVSSPDLAERVTRIASGHRNAQA